jgi:hypothetical protein
MTTEETNSSTLNSATIMVLGKHLYTVEHAMKLLKDEGYETLYMLEDFEEIDRRLLEKEFDMLLVVGSVEPHFKDNIIQQVQVKMPHVKIWIHRGGPATIPSEVKSALES